MILLKPTSPLRTADDIIGAYRLYKEKNAVSVVSVCEMEHSPFWSNILPPDMCLEGFIKPEVLAAGGRQNLDTYYRLNGAIYITKIDYMDYDFNRCLYNKNSFAYIMDRDRSVDIDSEIDFLIAESIIRNRADA